MGATKRKQPCIVNPAVSRKKSMKTPLPPCEGPKLARFADSRGSIEFLNLISEPESSMHSHVFEVKISGEMYALKMFHFYDPVADFFHLSNRQRDHLRYGDLLYHLDPFFVECRAYGKINAEKTDSRADVVAPGHGYLSLPATLEDKLAKDYGIDEWNRPDDDYNIPESKRPPFRAIVKKLMREDNVWDARSSNSVLQDVKRLHKMGVYNMDIRSDNFVGNKLVDFSVSRAEPSLLLSTIPRDQQKLMREMDLRMFDDMMEEQGVQGAKRAFRNLEYCRKLRSSRT